MLTKPLSKPTYVLRRFNFGLSRLHAPGSLLLAFFAAFCLVVATQNSFASSEGSLPPIQPPQIGDPAPSPTPKGQPPPPIQPPAAPNTANTWGSSATGSITTTTNWSAGHVPTVTEDAVFASTSTTGIKTFNSGTVTFGSLDVTATAGTYSIRNQNAGATNSTLNLGGAGNGGNGVSGAASSDLIFVAGGGTLALRGDNSAGGSGVMQVVLGQSGNFDAVGTINITSVISDGGNNFSITKTGAGTLTLAGANTFGGGLTISTGTVELNNNTAPGSGTLVLNGGVIQNTSAGAVTLTNNNTQTWGGDFTINASSGTQNLNLGNGAVTLTGNRAITVTGSGTVTAIVGGVIGDGGSGFSLTKTSAGAGTLILSGANTYSGKTTIGGGILSINSIKNVSGGASAVGAPTSVPNGTISIGNATVGATLKYTGTGDTTDRVIDLAGTTGNAILDQSGTNSLKFTSDFTASGSGNKTLQLIGSTAGTGEVAGAIVNSAGGTTSVLKNGTGTWTLSGASTYTGTTTVSSGTLSVDNNNSTTARLGSTTNVTVNAGGTLLLAQSGGTASLDRINDTATVTLNGGTFNTAGLSEHGASNNTAGIGALTLSASSIIDLGAGNSILAFSNSHLASWTGTLSIWNWSGTPLTGGGTDQVYFGNDNTGLTNTQLGAINFYSDNGTTSLGGAIMLVDGEIVPVPEPATWLTGALAIAGLGGVWFQRVRRRRATA